MENKKTIIQLNIIESTLTIISLLFGGFSIASAFHGEIENGYFYGLGFILPAGIIILRGRRH